MPKQQSTQQEPANTKETIEQKLDRIAGSLHRLDRRDRARTVWTTIRGIISMIPLLIVLGGAIYVYWKKEDLFREFTKGITTQIERQTRKPDALIKQLEQFLR